MAEKERKRADDLPVGAVEQVRELLNRPRSSADFSPAARYAVRMLLDYAGRASALEASGQDKDARIAEQKKLIADLNQQVSFLRMTLYDAGL